MDDDLPVPAAPAVIIQPGPVADLSFPPSSNLILGYMVRWKKTADAEWTAVGPLDNNAESFITPTLAAMNEYEFQLAMRTEKGRVGAYSPSTVRTTP